jgi:hypothetical protein
VNPYTRFPERPAGDRAAPAAQIRAAYAAARPRVNYSMPFCLYLSPLDTGLGPNASFGQQNVPILSPDIPFGSQNALFLGPNTSFGRQNALFGGPNALFGRRNTLFGKQNNPFGGRYALFQYKEYVYDR